eukprot:RCo005796
MAAKRNPFALFVDVPTSSSRSSGSSGGSCMTCPNSGVAPSAFCGPCLADIPSSSTSVSRGPFETIQLPARLGLNAELERHSGAPKADPTPAKIKEEPPPAMYRNFTPLSVLLASAPAAQGPPSHSNDRRGSPLFSGTAPVSNGPFPS